jgi:acyl-CoA thioesterase
MQDLIESMPDEVRDRVLGIIHSPFAQRNGIELVALSDDEVRMRMPIGDKMNSWGVGHGGAVFALADQVFALAANMGEHMQVALSANVQYVRPATGDLEAVSRRVAETRTTSVYEIRVLQGGKLVALFQGVGYKLKDDRCNGPPPDVETSRG